MKNALPATAIALVALAANAAWAGSPRGASTLAQFLGLESRSAACGCEPQCCPTPVCKPACEPKCCPPPVCEPKCCPPPVCEPKCCPPPISGSHCGCEPKHCPTPIRAANCGCEPKCEPGPCVTCCEPSCGCRGKKQYPLEKLLARMDGKLFGKSKCCEEHRDPCGYWLWSGVGQCCDVCDGHGAAPGHMPGHMPGPGAAGHGVSPRMLDPELLRQPDDATVDPFRDDPPQAAPVAPTGVRGTRLHPAIQRSNRW